MNNDVILKVSNLQTYFNTPQGTVRAVDGVSFEVKRGKVLGLVGESGCGKTVTALSILALLPRVGLEVFTGQIRYRDIDLLELTPMQMQKIRGKCISMVFQDPLSALNPVFTVGEQIAETLRLHLKMNRREARGKSIELLKRVGIPSPEKRYQEYPHQLSGGMRQRVMIAMAISCNPDVILADEPTTALDVTLQAQILDLLHDLREQIGMSMVLISHDLGVIAEMADEVAVMYAGQIVEYASTSKLFTDPLHPYSRGLLSSLPRSESSEEKAERLMAIPGAVPALHSPPPGCKFHPRCGLAEEICHREEPVLEEKARQHSVRCWMVEQR
jgi:peptide/nickel transport system ATP-binding protein/oligopeptide transport system ATP-binding protein